LQSHPESLQMMRWRFVSSRFGKGVLICDDSGAHWVCWSTVVVDQFESLQQWLSEGNDLQLPMRIYFYVIRSGMGRDYLMVSSQPRNGEGQ
jgi:hypothetical protein